jgi:hypothetical protein
VSPSCTSSIEVVISVYSYNGTPRGVKNCNEGICLSFSPLYLLIITQGGADIAIVHRRLMVPNVFAYMPKKMHFWNQGETEWARMQLCIAIRGYNVAVLILGFILGLDVRV